MDKNGFKRYAALDCGISSMTLHRYESVLDGYINPTSPRNASSTWPRWTCSAA